MPSPLAPSATGRPRPGVRVLPLVPFMLLAVVLVTALASWDEVRESAAGLDDFADHQAVLASSVASELSTRLAVARRDALLMAESATTGCRIPVVAFDGYTSFAPRPADSEAPAPPAAGMVLRVPASGDRAVDLVVPPVKLLEGASRIERPGSVRLLLQGPEGDSLHGIDGRVVSSDPIRRALAAGQSSLWLRRTDAADLGLPARRAAVGLAQVDAGPLGRWGVAVVSSAERERDRELRARVRLASSVLVAVGLVLAFGAVALRKQRRELVLEHDLAVADLKRERDERLASASRAATMGTLAMGIAHEVSTPLGIIAGRADQLLTRSSTDERATRSIRAILDQTDRIRLVVHGFLDLARGGAPVMEDMRPAAVLSQAVALVEHRFAEEGVTLVTEIAADLPALRCDVPMLEQALVNLLLNACDACARGGHVEAQVGGDASHVVFTIADDGAGITADDAARVMEPFFTTKLGSGTGLGLAIANEIVKLHRGKLALGPGSPRGTRAAVTIPRGGAGIEVAA